MTVINRRPVYHLDAGETVHIMGIGTVTAGSEGSAVAIGYDNGSTGINFVNFGQDSEEGMTVVTENFETNAAIFSFTGNNIDAVVNQEGSSAYINGSDTNVAIASKANQVVMCPNDGNNMVYLADGATRVVDGGNGNVTISDGALGTWGNDDTGYMTAETAKNSVFIGSQTETSQVFLAGDGAFVKTGAGEDRVVTLGTGENNTIYTGAGNDNVWDLGTGNYAHLGNGNDTLSSWGKDLIAEMGEEAGDDDYVFDPYSENPTIFAGEMTYQERQALLNSNDLERASDVAGRLQNSPKALNVVANLWRTFFPENIVNPFLTMFNPLNINFQR